MGRGSGGFGSRSGGRWTSTTGSGARTESKEGGFRRDVWEPSRETKGLHPNNYTCTHTRHAHTTVVGGKGLGRHDPAGDPCADPPTVKGPSSYTDRNKLGVPMPPSPFNSTDVSRGPKTGDWVLLRLRVPSLLWTSPGTRRPGHVDVHDPPRAPPHSPHVHPGTSHTTRVGPGRGGPGNSTGVRLWDVTLR